MKNKTPDQIRRETVPAKHTGLIYGFLGGLLGAVVWFGGWGLLHKEQVRRYPDYCTQAIKASTEHLSLFGAKPRPAAGMSAEQLRYALLRYGNLDHRYDADIIRHGWYPKEASPRPWVYDKGAVKPVYSDDAAMVFKWPLTLTSFTFLAALIWGLVVDYRYRSSIIAGLQFDGSMVATVEEYNREVKGDGMRYAVKPWKDPVMRGEGWTSIRIPEAKEASHQFRMGDTGTGKTSLTYQDLLDAEANGICCVVNDAKGGEILARFYRPERGDVILNPTDDRCAYWNISTEGYDLATYKTVMGSLFPPPVVRDPTADIFNQWTVSLGAYLLDQFRPDTETLGSWIANYREIERRVKGTIHQYTLPANSPQQRAGVLGTLALAGDPLWMMPSIAEGRAEFCIREWTREPTGWVFISSDSDTRAALKPLISMWMDLFILGLLSSNTRKRTKLIYDELHTLQTLTRLHDGITMLRSAGHQIIASIQNQEQLKHLYGDQTRTILSQAYTKWIFATSDPDSADILERIGGKRKLLRLEQTHSHGTTFYDRDRNSSRIVEVVEPAISATQIKGMSDLHAYFVQRGFRNNRMVIVPVQIPFVSLRERHQAYVERVVPRRDFEFPPDVEPLPEPPLEMPDEDPSRVTLRFD